MTIKVGILGTGKIGLDLAFKLKNNNIPFILAGHRESTNVVYARAQFDNVSTDSMKALAKCEIIVDCTNATQNKKTLKRFKNKLIINLTPTTYDGQHNLISCGFQVAQKLIKGEDYDYIELVNTVASKSVGMGTRMNINEYIYATEASLKWWFLAKKVKAILIINPSEPPVTMNVTIRLVKGGKTKTISKNIEGDGDYLPKYAGNLDIMTKHTLELINDYYR